MKQERNSRADFESLVRAHQAQIRSFVTAIAPDRSMADDLAQDVFLEALKSIDRFDESRDAGRWLRGIARNLARKAWREYGRNSVAGPDRLAILLESLAEKKLRDKQSRERSSVMIEFVKTCLEKLAPKARELLYLRYAEDRAPTDIARLTKTGLEAVYKALRRARAVLTKCVERQVESSV